MKFMFQRAPTIWPVLLLAAMLWGGEYLRRDLWEPDEGRYALVTREMIEGGDWLVMHRQGDPYAHKPPLFFWFTGTVASLAGGEVGRIAPRIPSFLGAVMAMWAASSLAVRWFSIRASWLVLLLLPSSYLFWNKGGFGQIDALLCGLEMMSLYFLFTAREGNAGLRRTAAYALAGLAVLAKGPVGLLVPFGVFLTASFFMPDGRVLRGRHLLWGPVLALLFPAAWICAAWMSGAPPDYLRELLFAQNIGRAAGEFGGHTQPFYYFLKYLPVDFLPWTILMPLGVTVLWRGGNETRAKVKMLAGWILFVVLFFSLSGSKRNLYILLAYPGAAILLAGGLDALGGFPVRWIRNSFRTVTVFLLILALGMIAAPWIPVEYGMQHLHTLPIGLLLLTGLLAAIRLYRRRPDHPAWASALAVSVLITFASVGMLVYPAFNQMKIPDEIVEPAQRMLKPDERIIMYYRNGEMFSLYSRRMGYRAFSDDEVRAFVRDSGQERHMIIFDAGDLNHLSTVVEFANEPVSFTMGNKKLRWAEVAALR